MWKITVAFLLFVLLAVNGESEMNKKKERELCPSGWKKYERQCYKLFKIKRNWNEAEKLCVGSKGHLVSVHKPAVNAFLKTFLQNRASHIWIGGYYATQRAAWTWRDGSKFGYTNWNAKPAVARNNKKCVLATSSKGALRWRRELCSAHFYFVCSKTAK
ncbi:snaclec coagulation factor IX-binding protein subunit A-like [Onychostoma macrolepis]|uniref:C-type lectin domain-containing protein n=1 Tax=Onychostoma macrolepis TaxID=369639 RepID=A0A7J6DH43_9TELE|nr:snaclec coagulation factor IX-binding protein subunit A-like [Onychostoma macrolepis]KAF4118652.1 hypothetical protein G5714_000703 [Onychostoma macrolepis]